VVGRKLLRHIHDQVAQLENSNEVTVQLAASGVDTTRHLAF
jgi:hypothetical protein